MSDTNQKNTTFQTSSRSRRRVKRQKPWLAVPLGLLVLLLGTALFFAVRHAIGKWGGQEPSSQPAVSGASTTQAAPATVPRTTADPSAASPSASETASGTAAPSSTATQEASTAQTTEASSQTTSESQSPAAQAFHLYTAREVLPVPEDISRELFEDINADDANGSWWFGRMTRNLETGEVEKGYDRSASTLALIDKYHGIYRKNTDQKVTYLTFDCGYEYGFTAPILDTLKEKGVRAVFFVAGDFVNDAANKVLLQRMYDEGHIIGSHTDHHLVMPSLSDEEFIDELNNLQIKVNNMLGREYQITYYRPPQGSTNERDLYLAGKMGLTTVLWSYAYGDYDTKNQMAVPEALEKAKVGLHDGSVYLLHAVSSTNAAMLGDLIDYMKSEGYEIRRIDE